MAYNCKHCEDTGFTAAAPEFAYMSWREVQRRGTQSNSMKRWAEHMPKAECPTCKGDFNAVQPVEPEPPVPTPLPPPKPKRKYVKRSPRWNK